MTAPRTVAGKAMLDDAQSAVEGWWGHEDWIRHITAIETEAFESKRDALTERLTLGAVRAALVMALAVDGYIDLNQMDGEQYIHGDASEYLVGQIDAAAASVHRFLTMTPQELEEYRALVLRRRKEEGRE